MKKHSKDRKRRNLVALHAHKFHRSQIQVDKKKALKRGVRRHKKDWVDTKAA